jgi:hypothetical protein
MSVTTQLIIYLCFCMLYRQRQLQYIFILRSLQTLKISKYREDISNKINKHEKRFKWFLFWPLLDMYEWYENWQANRNRNIKS